MKLIWERRVFQSIAAINLRNPIDQNFRLFCDFPEILARISEGIVKNDMKSLIFLQCTVWNHALHDSRQNLKITVVTRGHGNFSIFPPLPSSPEIFSLSKIRIHLTEIIKCLELKTFLYENSNSTHVSIFRGNTVPLQFLAGH